MKNIKFHGPWQIHQTDVAYRDPYVTLTVDQVTRPDGQPGQHVVVQLKPGVCVLPIDDQGQCYLTREFHYGIGRDSLEGVSGGIEPGEDSLESAKRELQEELGLSAEVWQRLITVDPFTTVVVSPTILYIARGLANVESAPEGTEQIERVAVALEDAIQLVQQGQITHAPTCILLLLAGQSL
jgi:ADP-ribose pyrophosphatase